MEEVLGDLMEQMEEHKQTEEISQEAGEQGEKTWEQLTEKEKEIQKETLLKSLYGIGGEHFSTFPTLLDKKINPFTGEYLQNIPSRVSEKTFKDWEPNGELHIIPLQKGTYGKVHYFLILLPNKDTKVDIWDLSKEDKDNYLLYTTANKAGEILLGKEHYHILNIYSNKNKAFNQAKALTKLFQMGTNNKTLEQQKELQGDTLLMDINSQGEQILQHKSKAGNIQGTYNTLGEYLNRELHSQYKDMDILTYIS